MSISFPACLSTKESVANARDLELYVQIIGYNQKDPSPNLDSSLSSLLARAPGMDLFSRLAWKAAAIPSKRLAIPSDTLLFL